MIDRKVWAKWLLSFAVSFAGLETYALRRGSAGSPPSTQEALTAQGLSEKAAFPTLSAYWWELSGIHPMTGRRHWTRPLLGVVLMWLTAHLLFMVPWPFEREVIDHVRSRVRRRSRHE